MKTPVTKTCSFAYAGTFGHECGKPATVVVVMRSTLNNDGVFYTGRCAKCNEIKGGENSNIIRREQYADQMNDWNGRYN